ncbi:CHASE2 domain-containing protein [bacterium]|nr:CHASE2 domain-containing protein [bacterium]
MRKIFSNGRGYMSLLQRVIVITSIAVLAYFISLFDFFQRFENQLYDLAFQMRKAPSLSESDIVIVAIDQETLDSLSYPFNRKHYATLIRKLNKLDARQIIFDIDFSSVGLIPESDSIFKAAIAETDKVVLSGMISYIYQRGLKEPLGNIKTAVPQVMPEGTPWGLVNEKLDLDGVTRRYPLFLMDGQRGYLSLALKTYSVLNNLDGTLFHFDEKGDFHYSDMSIPRVDLYHCLLHYYGPAGTFPTYSFLSVIRGEYDFDDLLSGMTDEERMLLAASGMSDLLQESPFKDKVVFVGASAEDLQDNKFTPFFSQDQRKTPGVEVHANALQMFYDRTFIRPVGFWWILFGTFLLSIIVNISGRQKSQWLASVISLILIFLVLSFNIWLFTSQRLWLHEAPLLLAILIGYPVNLIRRLILTQREKAKIRGMFARYLNENVVKELEAHPDKLSLGGERRRMSVLFSDVAGFTTISERLAPEEIISLLNEYLTAMTNIVIENGGIIDKYEGDLVMAEFGAPIWNPEHPIQCCRTALQMQKKLAQMRVKWHEDNRDTLYCRVGVNTGEMIVGNMGSEVVFDYTVMGDSVNLASRLEGANKIYGTEIIIGRETWAEVNEKFVTRPLDFIIVKGKTKPVTVFELLAEKESDLSDAKLKAVELFGDGLTLYKRGDFANARDIFNKALEVEPDDGPSKTYVERCAGFMENPPGEDWDGGWTLTEK